MMSRWIPLGLGIAMTAWSGMALAQTQSTLREDNVWGGRAHQPTESEVQQKEQAAGLPPAQQTQRASNGDVESIYRNLMRGPAPGR